MFFSIIQRKGFKNKMKTRIMYDLKNLDSDYEKNLDFLNLQKLNSLYKKFTSPKPQTISNKVVEEVKTKTEAEKPKKTEAPKDPENKKGDNTDAKETPE